MRARHEESGAVAATSAVAEHLLVEWQLVRLSRCGRRRGHLWLVDNDITGSFEISGASDSQD
jgi:hypothetical protein